MIDLYVLYNQIEAMKSQLEAMSQLVGVELAAQQEAARTAAAEPEKRKTFTRRTEIPGAPLPFEGNTNDDSPG